MPQVRLRLKALPQGGHQVFPDVAAGVGVASQSVVQVAVQVAGAGERPPDDLGHRPAERRLELGKRHVEQVRLAPEAHHHPDVAVFPPGNVPGTNHIVGGQRCAEPLLPECDVE